MLGAFWSTGSFMDSVERRSYFTEVWDTVKLAGDFLSSWTDGRTRQPLYSFDSRVGRDTQSTALLLATSMGIDSATRIAHALGTAPPPEWTRRKRDLDGLILFCCGAPNAQWRGEEILPFWHEEFDEAKPPEMRLHAWDGVMERRLEQTDPSDRPSLDTLCDAAILWRKDPDRLASLRSLLDATTPKGLEVMVAGSSIPFPDAYRAARHFIAAALIYAPNPPL
jgi:hypothetical protein